jgi:probable F420-dependent oxidoreductase
LCIDYHHPVVLAKELATLDLFSGGRLEVGLGAGWITSEYDAMGIPMDAASTRIGRLAEVVALLKASFRGEEVDIDGVCGVRAHGYRATPAPVQQPGPPIVIGGGGRRVLELAAREGDIVTFNFDNRAGMLSAAGPRGSTDQATAEKVRWVRDAAGDRDPVLEMGCYFVNVTDRPRDAAAAFQGFFQLEIDDIIRHPHVLVGTVDAICETLEERRERYGFSSINVLDNAAEEFAPVVARLAGR